jgi:hypothetical protein
VTDNEKTIEMTFIGHQTWLFAAGSTSVLVDPILGATFGNSVESTFAMPIFPPRVVDLEKMPRVDAVILSHEHIDHFNLETFSLLDRRTSVLVGEFMLDSVVDAIRALGFTVTRCPLREELSIGAFRCVLYGATSADIAYERRVTQMYLWTEPEINVLNTVDCLLSPALEEDVRTGRVPPPRNVIVSNNGMLPSDGARRAYYNVSHLAFDSRQCITCLLDILGGIRDLPEVEHVYMMGNGLLPWGGEYGPFAWADNGELAAMVNEISVGPVLFGPYPGDQFSISPPLAVGQAPWIDFDREKMEALKRVTDETQDKPAPAPLPVLTRPFPSEEAARQALAEVEAELVTLAPTLLATDVGQSFQVIDDPNYPALGPRRVLLYFDGGPGGRPVQYALDLNRSAFVPDDTPRHRFVETFPHGLAMQLCDFHAILQGRLGVWDTFFAPVQCWFPETTEVASQVNHLLTALGNIYGEQARPDLASKINERAVRQFSARQ